MCKKILIAAIACATIPLGTAFSQTIVLTDDFATAYNYQPGVVTGGAAPTATNGPAIWSGVWNAGIWNPIWLDQNIPFNSNTDAAGELKIGPGIGAAQSLGWGDQQSDAPMLFVRVPAGNALAEATGATFDFQATVKLTSQTFGNWSTAGIIARTADVTNNPSGSRFGGILDESFTTGMIFNAVGTRAQKRIENGLQQQDTVANWTAGTGLVTPAALPVYLRLTRTVDFFSQPSYDFSMSTDGVNFVLQSSAIPTAGTPLADRNRPLDIGLSWHPFNGAAAAAAAGQATFDDFKLEYAGTAQREVVALPPLPGPCDAAGSGCRWNVNGNGNLDLTANWIKDADNDITTTAPNSNTSRMIFGALQNTTEDVLVTNVTRTLKEMSITNTTTQIIFGGAGTLNFDSDSGPALINVNSSPVAGHQIQLKMTLQDNLTATATGATTLLSINAPIVLNGHTLTVAGTGQIKLNNGTIAAGAGAGAGSVVNEGDLSGLSSVDGDLSQSSTGSLGVTVGGSPISVGGAAVLDGVLDVSLANGFTPVNGQTYTVLTAGSVTNAGLALGGDAGAMFRLSVGAGSVSLTAVPEPTSIALMGLGALAVGLVRRRRKTEVSSSRDFNNMGRFFVFSAALAIVALGTSVSKAVLPGPAPVGLVVETRTDTFDVANDYKAGAFPGGTIWTGIWNKDNGGATAVVSTSGGLLTMEDLREKDNTAGLTFGAGWEGPNNGGGSNAPYLYTTFDAPAGRTYDMDIYAKVSSQWNGNWSKSAIVTRVAGVAPGKDPGTGAFPATETFISAGTFLPQDNFQVQRVLNGTDAGVQTGNAVDRLNVAADPFWTDPIWIGISKRQDPSGGGTYRYYTSLDDVATPDLVTTWTDTGLTTALLPLFGDGANVEVGLSHHEFFLAGAAGGGIPAGQRPHTMYDYFSATAYDTPYIVPSLTATWNINNDNLSNFTTAGNWVVGAIGAAPGNPAAGGNTHKALLGSVITQPRTVILNAVRTLKQLEFDNANTYALTGLFRLTMEAATGQATIDVLQGSHLISAPITFNSTTNLIANGATSRLDINNELNMGTQAVSVSGNGKIFINSILDVVPQAVVTNTGNLGGSGRINGSLTSTAGSINPGSSVGTLSVDNGYTQTSTTLNIELAGTAAGLFDKLAVTGNATLTSGIVDITTIGFTPTSGNTWDIVTASGTLTSGLTIAAGDVGYSLSVVTANTLRLTFTGGLTGDYNENGFIDAADYTVYRNRKSGIGGTTLPNDPTPGSITFSDYQYWKAHYGGVGAGTGTSAGGSGNVPEPTSIALMLIAAMGACGLIRQR